MVPEFRQQPLPPLAVIEREWRELETVARPSFFTSWHWIGTLLAILPERSRPNLLRGSVRGETVALAREVVGGNGITLDSDVAAVSSGINPMLTKTLAFAISAAFAGAAGSLFVLSAAYAQPDEFGLLLSIRLLIGAAVGGLGSLWGVVVGATFVQMLPVWAQGISKQAPAVIQGLAVILVMFLLPTGFAGLLRRVVAPLSNRIRNAS